MRMRPMNTGTQIFFRTRKTGRAATDETRVCQDQRIVIDLQEASPWRKKSELRESSQSW
jgi:hypothetical protein